MNRELKFRAWNKETKSFWRSGFCIEPGGKTFYYKDGCVIPIDLEVNFFTGLKDKNGKEIYEGDIISGWRKGSNSDRGYTGIIEWRTEQAGWVVKCHKFIMDILGLAMEGWEHETRLSSFEIIGNIYESPELIK